MNPKLTLIGAGSGDPDLITLKAIKALKVADVVLYDALANEELLDYCPAHCQKIYVGKRGHQPSVGQDSINFMIVEKAFECGHVVRLKGGDPFIFGRGIEEIEYANQRGIETAYIPGISSVMSGGFQNIPLTARGVVEGFWVMTATKAETELANDLRLAAQANATIVILMGMHRLNYILEQFRVNNKSEMPVAIIQNATLPNEKMVVGTVGTIEDLAKKQNIKAPAVIIIGEVVKYHEALGGMTFEKSEIYTHNPELV